MRWCFAKMSWLYEAIWKMLLYSRHTALSMTYSWPASSEMLSSASSHMDGALQAPMLLVLGQDTWCDSRMLRCVVPGCISAQHLSLMLETFQGWAGPLWPTLFRDQCFPIILQSRRCFSSFPPPSLPPSFSSFSLPFNLPRVAGVCSALWNSQTRFPVDWTLRHRITVRPGTS